MSKSYAIGEGGIRSNEKTDNAKYYSEEAKNSSNDAKESAYDSDMHSMLAKSYAVGESTVTLGDGVDELVTDDGFTIELFGREGEDTDNAKYYSEQASTYEEKWEIRITVLEKKLITQSITISRQNR